MTKLWLALALSAPLAAQTPAGAWKFAISGDSRNCGDIVMPAIAAGVLHDGANFYWHLGDFRAIYTFDEDLEKPLNIITYETTAWPDFIAHQMAPFGNLPVFLTPGNHETIPPASRQSYLIQFADWLGTPAIRQQRLADDPTDHALHTYYHWIDHNIDFIALDNASNDEFDDAQMKWFHSVVQRDEASGSVRAIVVGMHAALPGSFGYSHSMSDWPVGQTAGKEVYETLWHAQDTAHKHVYIMASHSHFFMQDVYHTDYWKGKVIPGWIVGTAGAVRYRLPPNAPPPAMTDVYGYLLATAKSDGAIDFQFHKIEMADLKKANPTRPESILRFCVDQNKQ
jgi:Calcineurin-like phosphoesterase